MNNEQDFEHKTYGHPDEFFSPLWSCLTEPDIGLINYYDLVLGKPFDKKRFRRPGLFRNVGSVDYRESFSCNQGIRCLDLPIKMAASNEYKIPVEFSYFLDPISKIISFENAHNEKVIDFYAYLTIDQLETKIGEYQRTPGLHVDGFQGARINPKVVCDRSYVVTDCNCPSFWNQGFESVEMLDDAKYNIFHDFDNTKHYSSEIKLQPYNIYLMDCYAVHSANKAECGRRTFLRLSYSVRRYDRLGNSHNACFDYQWDMVQRDVSETLIDVWK